MAHGQGSWRASTLTVPSGADIGSIYRVLSAGNTALRVISFSGYGSVGSARFSVWLIPSGQGTAAIYTISASEPIYCISADVAINGTAQSNPVVFVPSNVAPSGAAGGSWTIPAGWSLGVMPNQSTTGDGTFTGAAVKTQL